MKRYGKIKFIPEFVFKFETERFKSKSDAVLNLKACLSKSNFDFDLKVKSFNNCEVFLASKDLYYGVLPMLRFGFDDKGVYIYPVKLKYISEYP